MMSQTTSSMGILRFRASVARFRDDERGSMALIMVFTFLAMIMFGGIAVDVMRFETRRVAMQQTLDRAALAAAGLPVELDRTKVRTPTAIATDWFAKANIGANLSMVEFGTPIVSEIDVPGRREVTISASVRSYNFFMGIFSPRDFLEGPTSTKAAQGVSNIEVMLVLDLTWSMRDPAGDGKSKIQALREAATSFVNIIEANDKRDGVSIGIVPYRAQVSLPVNLRQQFNATHIASLNGVPNSGIPNVECMEIPEDTYTSTALSRTLPIPMTTFADSSPRIGDRLMGAYNMAGPYQNPVAPSASASACNANGSPIMLPTKNGDAVLGKIATLSADGNTYTAVGMRWATALMDETARDIYTAIGDSTVQGRPADNGSQETRKIIILMTDGDHFVNNHMVEPFKSGPSPIWIGREGSNWRYAVRFWNEGPWHNGRVRPTCAGSNEYFVPHRKRAWFDVNGNGREDAGERGACDPQAWSNSPSWPGVTAGTVRQLDWSEVWHRLRVSYVVQQMYMRSNVVGMPTDINSIMAELRRSYMGSVTNLDRLLLDNCAAARAEGFEIYGIAFGSTLSPAGAAQISGCASEPKITYYFRANNGSDLLAAFNLIATDISDLRLTQ